MRDSFKQMLDVAARHLDVDVWGFALDGYYYCLTQVQKLGGK
jgi:hypothetical protein